MDVTIFLSDDEIYLRVMTEEDIPVWHRWFNDPETTKFMTKGYFPNTIEEQRTFLRKVVNSKTDLQLGIVLKGKNLLVGTAGLHEIDFLHRTADLRIAIGEEAMRGIGVGRRACALLLRHGFQKLGLHKITSGMLAVNETSRRLFESLGFVREAVLREQIGYEGRRTDLYKYGLLAHEWRERNL